MKICCMKIHAIDAHDNAIERVMLNSNLSNVIGIFTD